MTGLSNDITTMQITAPIQPGSSGGPLIDKSGNVVGMISSKLNEIMVAKAIGSISQNVNFAIKIRYAEALLSILPHGERVLDRPTASTGSQSLSELAERIKPFVVLIKATR